MGSLGETATAPMFCSSFAPEVLRLYLLNLFLPSETLSFDRAAKLVF